MIYKKIISPILFLFDGEKVHTFIMKFLNTFSFVSNVLLKIFCVSNNKNLEQTLFNSKILFKNPIGLGAGFDKNAEYMSVLKNFGFGFLEFGTVTPKEQYGNPKPRVFRLKKHNSLQNFMGFSNLGYEYFLQNIQNIQNTQIGENVNMPIGINIGKNKNQTNVLTDYEFLLKVFDKKSEYITINISSPNTKGLRDLQNEGFLKDIFAYIKTNKISSNILLKISPDMSKKNTLSLCKSAIKLGVDGIIISNTTIDYSLCDDSLDIGGISGELLRKKSRQMLKYIAKNIDYKKTILISCGGISNANEAYKRIRLGASLIQIYTALIYEGVGVCKNINVNLAKILKKDGFCNITQAIGADIK